MAKQLHVSWGAVRARAWPCGRASGCGPQPNGYGEEAAAIGIERGLILAHSAAAEPTRRDFLFIATGAVGAVGLAATVWPFINQMNPDASALALASTEVDIASLNAGESVTVKWRGKPVVVRNRTAEEIEAAKTTPLGDLKRPARPQRQPARRRRGDRREPRRRRQGELVRDGQCLHPSRLHPARPGGVSSAAGSARCHGSVYDTAGRIRIGPAPENMAIPVYSFMTDTKIKIG